MGYIDREEHAHQTTLSSGNRLCKALSTSSSTSILLLIRTNNTPGSLASALSEQLVGKSEAVTNTKYHGAIRPMTDELTSI